jgi:hypothetical protein
LLALLVMAVSMSAAVLCVTLACPVAAPASACHSTPAGPRLSDCCPSHASSPVVSESGLAPAAGPRLALWAAPVAPATVAAGSLDPEPVVRRAALPLFTLHRSLLL